MPDDELRERADQTWFILREPGCVPERKGPYPSRMLKSLLIEFFDARPSAFITVLALHDEGPSVQDGPECLEILDGRYSGRAAKHRASTSAAFALSERRKAEEETREVTDDMVTAAMREFEQWSAVLRYREKDKWHANDVAGMREALKAAIRSKPKETP